MNRVESTKINIVIPGARGARGNPGSSPGQCASVSERERVLLKLIIQRADARWLGSLPEARYARLAGNDSDSCASEVE
jgi:hypothetical protein